MFSATNPSSGTHHKITLAGGESSSPGTHTNITFADEKSSSQTCSNITLADGDVTKFKVRLDVYQFI